MTMENPFIKYWLWYYDMLWTYWPIVLVLIVVPIWLIHRRFERMYREWEAYMKKWPRSDTKPKKKPIRRTNKGTMSNQKFGTLDVEPIDVEELKKLSKEEMEAMWEEASHLQWKE